MTRVSPPDEARELPGPQVSTRVTRAPRRSRNSADHPPNAPAPTTTTRGRALRRSLPDREAAGFADVRRFLVLIADPGVYRSLELSGRASFQGEEERDSRRDQKRRRGGSRHIASKDQCPRQMSTAVQDLDDRRCPG